MAKSTPSTLNRLLMPAIELTTFVVSIGTNEMPEVFWFTNRRITLTLSTSGCAYILSLLWLKEVLYSTDERMLKSEVLRNSTHVHMVAKLRRKIYLHCIWKSMNN